LNLSDKNDIHRVWMGVSIETAIVVRDVDGKRGFY